MSFRLTPAIFRQLLTRSSLLTREQLAEIDSTAPRTPALATDVHRYAQWLVEQNYITGWQAGKLLQARHRGFHLGRYRLLDRIARGGMSSIYLAEHLVSGDRVALKVLPPDRVDRESYLPRFRREAAVATRLIHPNIVRVFEVLEDSDGRNPVHAMAMEYLEGEDLFEHVRRCGPMPFDDAAESIRQAAEGLACAHSAGLIHRDVKPGNLFRLRDGIVKLLDLGLAHHADSEENLTRDYNERVLGTADYLAPEQAVDSHSIDCRADIYALGCTLWFLLTTEPPFPEGTLAQRIIAHQTRPPAPLHLHRRHVPAELERILLEMLAKNPDDRPQSAEQIARALGDWLGRQPSGIAVPPDSGHCASASSDARNAQSENSPPTGHRPVHSSTPYSDAPTGRLQDCETPPPLSDRSAGQDQPEQMPVTPASPYQQEFLRFLAFLDASQGVDTVMHDDSRRNRLRQLAARCPDTDSEILVDAADHSDRTDSPPIDQTRR